MEERYYTSEYSLIKRLFFLAALASLAFILLNSCATSGEDTETDPDPPIVPTNLVLSYEQQGSDAYNPYGSGTGTVTFTATATNAVSYDFVLEGPNVIESDSGTLTYTYEEEGTHTYNVSVTAVAESGETASTTASITVYRSTDEFPTVVWADEFDYEGALDSDKWHHQVIPILGDSWANSEVQHYTDRTDNSFVSEGTLKIVALKEDYTYQGTTKSYTSARLNSKFAFQYGRIEVRAKLPVEAGTWPAIWTLGANIDEVGNYFDDQYGSVGWPRCGEIDILEQRGADKANTIAYFHWFDTGSNGYQNAGNNFFSLPTATTDFHVYSLRWNEQSLRVFADDVLVYELENTESRPYDDPHYLLLNIAMGGTLGGSIPGDFNRATMEVDYVRIYQ